MAKKKKTRQELEIENGLLKRNRGVSAIASVLNNLIRWGGLVAIFYWMYRSVDTLSGKQTDAIFDVGIITSITASVAFKNVLPWILAFLGVGYGLKQRSLRKTTIERLQDRIRELEKHVDPGRSSSGLTPRGDTHPKDR